jgi:hypothetical protein
MVVEFASKTMPIFSRQEIEALLDRSQKLSDQELNPVLAGETRSVDTNSLVEPPQRVDVRYRGNKRGVLATTSSFEHLRAA